MGEPDACHGCLRIWDFFVVAKDAVDEDKADGSSSRCGCR